MIRLKLDKTDMDLLLANADLGGLCFAYEEKKIKSHADTSAEIFDVLDLIESKRELLIEGKGYIELSNSQMVTLLTAVRSAFHLLMKNDKDLLMEVLVSATPEFVTVEFGKLTTAAQSAHIILDYLEVSCSEEVLKMWMAERRCTAHVMYESLVQKFSN